jgi:hypothetical protein
MGFGLGTEKLNIKCGKNLNGGFYNISDIFLNSFTTVMKYSYQLFHS